MDGCLNNLWTTAPHKCFSWQVNKLLKLSRSMYSWIKVRVQNGHSCRFWSDNWSEYGCLQSYLSINNNSGLGIPPEATLASLYQDNRWRIPPARSEALVNIHVLLTTTHLNESEDYYEWEVDGKRSKSYNIGLIYEKLCDEGILVPWSSKVWNKGGIPRHNFLSWLFVLRRCPTKDRILDWGLQTDPNCMHCNLSTESRNHLFFDCNFVWSNWEPLAQRCGIQPQRSWDRVMTQLQSISCRSPSGILICLC